MQMRSCLKLRLKSADDKTVQPSLPDFVQLEQVLYASPGSSLLLQRDQALAPECVPKKQVLLQANACMCTVAHWICLQKFVQTDVNGASSTGLMRMQGHSRSAPDRHEIIQCFGVAFAVHVTVPGSQDGVVNC